MTRTALKPMNRGDKLYLDEAEMIESAVNHYLSCRDGIVEAWEYVDESGYGSNVRLFLCKDTKHEAVSIVRQTWIELGKGWMEEVMSFDSDSFMYLEAIITGKKDLSGTHLLVRSY